LFEAPSRSGYCGDPRSPSDLFEVIALRQQLPSNGDNNVGPLSRINDADVVPSRRAGMPPSTTLLPVFSQRRVLGSRLFHRGTPPKWCKHPRPVAALTPAFDQVRQYDRSSIVSDFVEATASQGSSEQLSQTFLN
jgi:hypothetical protein